MIVATPAAPNFPYLETIMGIVIFILVVLGIIAVGLKVGGENVFKAVAWGVAAIVALNIASFLFGFVPDWVIDGASALSEWAAIAISLAFLGFSLYACAVVLGDLFHEARRFVSRLWQSATAKTRP